MMDMKIIAEVAALKPAKSLRKRWKQYSDTLQLLVEHVSAEERDELAKKIANRLEL